MDRRDVITDDDIIALFQKKGWAITSFEMENDGTTTIKFWCPSDIIRVEKRTHLELERNNKRQKLITFTPADAHSAHPLP